jgi:hypothetical protein
MVYREKEIGELLDAREQASKILKDHGLKGRRLSMEEAHLLLATSHLLLDTPDFYPQQVLALTNNPAGATSQVLNRFEQRYGLFKSSLEPSGAAQHRPERVGGRPRRIYRATPRGEIVLALFQK